MVGEPDALKTWAEEHLERCRKTTDADTGLVIKKAVAGFLKIGERDKQVVIRMQAAGFILNRMTSGGKKRACQYTFAGYDHACFVKLV